MDSEEADPSRSSQDRAVQGDVQLMARGIYSMLNRRGARQQARCRRVYIQGREGLVRSPG
jgi:hypothetical protein